MTRRITRKEMVKQDEFIEAAFDAGQWIEKHWKTVASVAGAVLAVVVVVALWNWWGKRTEAEVSRLLAEGLDLYEAPAAAPRYADAIPVFEKAAKRGGGSPAGLVARYYVGAAQLRLGRAGEAAATLQEVADRAADRTLADSARALLAEAYAAAGDTDKAAATYRHLAEQTGGAFPPDVALLQAGKLLAAHGRTQEAHQAWQDLVSKYPQSGSAAEARSLLQPAGAPVPASQ